MRKFYLASFVFFALSWTSALGQVFSNCVQVLRQAQSIYENGRLHELPALLKPCLEDGFTNEEKRQAYKLLAQSYIYLEEPELADDAMLKLLQTDHFFRPNNDVDPAEFISLWSKFRTSPLFRFGIKLGPSLNSASPIIDYSIGADSRGTGKYTPKTGFFIGAIFEKDFLPSKRLTLAPELAYSTKSFIEESTQFYKDGDSVNTTNTDSYEELKLAWVEFNPLVKYQLTKNEEGFQLFAMGGPGVNFLTKAVLADGKLNRNDGSGTVTGAEVDTKNSFKKANLSAIVGIGARRRLGGVYVTADIRFQYGLTNIVHPSRRLNLESAFDYGYILNDMRVPSVLATIGIQYAQFNPKKLIK